MHYTLLVSRSTQRTQCLSRDSQQTELADGLFSAVAKVADRPVI